MIENRFLTTRDERCERILPHAWWSRPFEYQFCLKQIRQNDIILDAGCGIEHPFKLEAARLCKKVIAIDKDPRLIETKKANTNVMNTKKNENDNIEYKLGNIIDSSKIISEKVDKVFCISVLEHMPVEDVIKSLNDFSNCLKEKGTIILTVDYPTLTPAYLMKVADSIGLEIVGKYDYEIKNNLITDGTLNVFTMILKLAKIKMVEVSKEN